MNLMNSDALTSRLQGSRIMFTNPRRQHFLSVQGETYGRPDPFKDKAIEIARVEKNKQVGSLQQIM